jgi:hypothetical protein
MRKFTRVLGALLLFSLLVSNAEAFLPTAVETAVRGWFSSAGKLVGMRFYEDTSPPTPLANTCDLYMDSATDSLIASCDGGAGRVIVGSASTACTEDGNGNLTCNTMTSLDQNSLVTPASNRFRIFDNDVDVTPNPSCTDLGQAGILSLLDKDESSVDNYVWCDGTTEKWSISLEGRATKIMAPFGFGHGSSTATAMTDDNCACRLFSLDRAILDLDMATVIVTSPDTDANEATTLGIYSFDGLTQYFTGALTDTSGAVVNVSNATAAPGTMIPGDYWFCTAHNAAAAVETRLRAVDSDTSRSASFSQTCAAGALPATLTSAAITFNNVALPHVILTDE